MWGFCGLKMNLKSLSLLFFSFCGNLEYSPYVILVGNGDMLVELVFKKADFVLIIFLSKIRYFFFWRWNTELQPNVLPRVLAQGLARLFWCVTCCLCINLGFICCNGYTEVTVSYEYANCMGASAVLLLQLLWLPLFTWIRLAWLWYDAKPMTVIAIFFTPSSLPSLYDLLCRSIYSSWLTSRLSIIWSTNCCCSNSSSQTNKQKKNLNEKGKNFAQLNE